MSRGPIVSSHPVSASQARRIWLRAQRLDVSAPFGAGPDATPRAIAHLGYVQIDTINVIERCHHHILYSRIPDYRRTDLGTAQSDDKSVFEYWTHALAYVPRADYRYFMGSMARLRETPNRWFGTVAPRDVKTVLRRIRAEGPLSMRDFDSDVRVDKTHPWASRKPSKRVLEMAFFQGHLTVSAREGMLKTYDLSARHFGWPPRPRPASEHQVTAYVLDRALRAQGMVSLQSICHLDAPRKKAVNALIAARVRAKKLVPVHLANAPEAQHWVTPAALAASPHPAPELVHILSPFDPLIIQRPRLKQFFGYDHQFEAYLPSEKRKIGYFALPVLMGDEIAAVIDLKADRAAKSLLVQNLHWRCSPDATAKTALDEALDRFAAFQFA
ncbi:crosslink repair DNA glycosylase YcaQ family protein [Devosia algicola]|uniref:Crosslink repair DNA glycosylase YcaQ family protein n=1 Tax=Devosia algicola TaxID=3026418 RepID=A0ABY7YLQ4_9HYPH|nr:crosslink repair DNA glycosylase YcaQ family protein [Devosia algicola]WDR01989.1 crosslink repair DNA glycosylase YcaQ family protein [Devosia algicola]